MLVPGTSRGTQTLLTINQLLTASSMVWLRLRLETDSSCLYCNPSFICTVCTKYEAFLCALCFASEGPLGPVKHCFILITSHDKKDYGCVQMIDYGHEWPAAVCTAIPHLSVQCVQYMEPFFVPSVWPPRDRLDQLNPALF